MIYLDRAPRIWLSREPVDFRRGVNGLAALVAQALQADPYSGDVFIFRSKRKDRLKLLMWDGTGVVLATKLVEGAGVGEGLATAGQKVKRPLRVA
ncbi:IS66 family insertion sequence element accessory protein TnpB [Mesorhizobium sp.]|uniref:IS66 family insertion sequence element accessory protein TnpB n=1 Tax=Mesorhizobium sp. TaxID=1871066 RepID=UPI00257A93E5|nr:IS66 family insertion sequence element accessory protein TnpB [Mesorhizobium sp.]